MKIPLTFKGPRLIWTTMIFSIAVCAFVYLQQGITEEAIRLNIRITARISFLLFSLVFVASSLHALIKNTFTSYLLQNRRFIGLSFGISHIIHLLHIFILLFAIYEGDVNGLGGLKKLAPAITVYIYIFIMMATSNDYSMKLLGYKTWTWIHRLGMYSIAAALWLGFYKVVGKSPMLYLSLLSILIAEALLRVYTFARKHLS